MLHLDANSELDVKHCLAYSEVSVSGRGAKGSVWGKDITRALVGAALSTAPAPDKHMVVTK